MLMQVLGGRSEAWMSLTTLGNLTIRMDQRRGGACALIAIKERRLCKTRLSRALAPVARIELVRSMLAAVLSAASHAETVGQIVVVSPERDSVPTDVPVLADTGESLNSALTQAYRVLCESGCQEVMILPADLPNITAAEIDDFVRAGRNGGFSIAPDARGMGTNALCLGSGQPFRFQFGLDSQRLHLHEAERQGFHPRVVRLPGLEFDVDLPADLSRLDSQRWLTRLQA